MAKTVTILPDEIGFSQDNIKNQFSAFKGKRIGEVLDDICNKKMSMDVFLKGMKVGKYKKKSEKWFTVNNRSLWVLKQLRLNGIIGENKKICFAVQDIEPERFTTHDEGKTIVVRQKPVGGEKAIRHPYWRYRNETWDGKPANTVQFRRGRPLMKGGSSVAETGAQALPQGGVLIDYESDYDSDEYYE